MLSQLHDCVKVRSFCRELVFSNGSWLAGDIRNVTGRDRDSLFRRPAPEPPISHIMAPKRKAENIADAVDLVDLEDGWMKKLLDIDNDSLILILCELCNQRRISNKRIESHSHRSLQ